MKRFDARKGWGKLPAKVRTEVGRITMDLAVANANIALIETMAAGLGFHRLPREQGAILRASRQVVILATAEICGLLQDHLPGTFDQLPIVPRGLGRVCHFCGCSEGDACVGAISTCGWHSSSIPMVRDVCTFCHVKGLADDEAPSEDCDD